MAFELDIDKQVDFHGVIESKKLDEFYRRACIFVMPSLFPESFGMSGLEAMAFGKPVIAYDSGGIRDWLVHGETGFLVEPGNPELISAGLERLFSNKEQRIQMGAKAKARVDKYFRKEGHLEKIMRTYHSVIEARKQGKGKG
jgi:glycosyltransferase involved in cell wall biosynthesis